VYANDSAGRWLPATAAEWRRLQQDATRAFARGMAQYGAALRMILRRIMVTQFHDIAGLSIRRGAVATRTLQDAEVWIRTGLLRSTEAAKE
jgi:hypothetical protein